jgi:hypothetical protein
MTYLSNLQDLKSKTDFLISLIECNYQQVNFYFKCKINYNFNESLIIYLK